MEQPCTILCKKHGGHEDRINTIIIIITIENISIVNFAQYGVTQYSCLAMHEFCLRLYDKLISQTTSHANMIQKSNEKPEFC